MCYSLKFHDTPLGLYQYNKLCIYKFRIVMIEYIDMNIEVSASKPNNQQALIENIFSSDIFIFRICHYFTFMVSCKE